MQRLSDIYFNTDIDDNEIIGRILNVTITGETNDPIVIFIKLLDMMKALNAHDCQQKIDRPRVRNIIDSTFALCNAVKGSKEKLDMIVSNIKKYSNDKTNCDSIYIMCICRSIWEIEFDEKIAYKNASYAAEEIIGMCTFSVFMRAIENNDFVML